jgi:hypothetical protein
MREAANATTTKGPLLDTKVFFPHPFISVRGTTRPRPRTIGTLNRDNVTSVQEGVIHHSATTRVTCFAQTTEE